MIVLIITVMRKVLLSFSMQIITAILRIDTKIAVKEPFLVHLNTSRLQSVKIVTP